MLDHIFTTFDALAEKHQLQRLRTVGDSYVVVRGTFETLRAAGRVLCSENFYWRAGKEWRFEPGDVREVEGVGTTKTFYLVGPAEKAAEADLNYGA